MDWLTWQGVRGLATGEVLVPRSGTVQIAQPDPARPAIKWTTERRWFDSAVPMTPPPGAILYARKAWMASTRTALVQAVPAPAVLATTFYDPMVGSAAAAELLAPSSPIRAWFAVQTMTTHPQLTAMPVGVEVEHVPLYRATEQRSVRDILLYLNFTLARRFFYGRPVRAQLWHQFAGRSWVTAERPGDPRHYLAQLGRSQFVLSPPGYGWDCYRTYEAMVMGAIPIVKRHPPCSDVLDGLPVLLVDRWADITPERLRHAWETRPPADLRRITLEYWRERIAHASRLAACAPRVVSPRGTGDRLG